MTRKEVEERHQREKQRKESRVIRTLELFINNKGNITDENLARLLALEGIESSSSTVGRDLTINLRNIFIAENQENKVSLEFLEDNGLTRKQTNIICFIMQKRKENKHKGQIKGGKTAVFNNDIIKNELTNKFESSKGRRHV